jgi:hypothetical protein
MAMSLVTVACQQEAAKISAPEASENEVAFAARTTPGSTAGVTWVRTLADLRNMTNMTANYKLANDIDAGATAQVPFIPIGFTKDFFRGTFDGNNKTISNLTIRGGDYTGIFTKAYWALFRNIRLVNVNVTGGYSTGAIAGYAEGIDFVNSYVQGVVTGNSTGNRLGLAFGSVGNFTRISRCYTKGRVKGTGYHFGGLVGHAAFYGVVDHADDARIMIDEVFVQDTIAPTFPAGNAMVAAGGLVGTLLGGSINNVNSVCEVTGRHAAGGLVGNIINNDPTSTGSYIRGGLSRGTVTDNATPNRTGAIGMMSGSLIWSGGAYYDKDTDGGVTNPNIPDAACQNGFTSSALKSPTLAPTKLLKPYIYGMLIDQQAIIDFGFEQCRLASGSDGDWGFGTCNTTPVIWSPNSASEYNTLLRIPNPSVQPK